MQKVTPCLWFDDQAEEAANLYTSIFPNSRITDISRYGETGPGTPGAVMTVAFELDGQPFTALNGGPQYTFSEAVSFPGGWDPPGEVDREWEGLGGGGGHGAGGWGEGKVGLWGGGVP